MDPGILDVAAYSREAMQLDIHELMDPTLRKPITACNLAFPHKCSVNGGAMRGSWGGGAGSSGQVQRWPNNQPLTSPAKLTIG